MNDYKKCRAMQGGYSDEMCEALSSVIEFAPRTNSKGVFGRNIVNIQSGKSLGVMVVLKQGKHISRGIALNVCPFCGGSLMDQGGAA
ncbi:MAG: hypothetical protein ACRCXB_25595 [Aeromonadaceae bacterium]